MGVQNMKRCNRMMVSTLGVAMGLALSAGAATAQDCTTKIGAVLPTSVDWGRPIAETAQFVVDQVNEAGGVAGCNVEMVLRDSQVDPKVGVDAAKALLVDSTALTAWAQQAAQLTEERQWTDGVRQATPQSIWLPTKFASIANATL